jgi:hypothetical protein
VKLKTLSVLAGFGGALIVSGPASGKYLGLARTSSPNPYGIHACNISAQFDNPNDRVLAVAGTASAPLSISVLGGTFHQNELGGDTAPPAALVDVFPSLAYDTFVTVGVQEDDGSDGTLLPPGWPGFSATELAGTDLAWFVTPDAPQGMPDEFGGVLLGQFSHTDGVAPIGRFLLLAISDGEPILRYTGFCCFLSPGPCTEGDIDFDNVVGVGDFLALLGAWGPCPPQETCWADLDQDGGVGVVDFLLLLAYWTLEHPEPLPSVDADLNGDGVVNVVDLLTLLSCWGPAVGGCAPADLDGDGVVGTRDLLIMLVDWD